MFNHTSLIWHVLNVFGAKRGDRRQKRALAEVLAHITSSRETSTAVSAAGRLVFIYTLDYISI